MSGSPPTWEEDRYVKLSPQAPDISSKDALVIRTLYVVQGEDYLDGTLVFQDTFTPQSIPTGLLSAANVAIFGSLLEDIPTLYGYPQALQVSLTGSGRGMNLRTRICAVTSDINNRQSAGVGCDTETFGATAGQFVTLLLIRAGFYETASEKVIVSTFDAGLNHELGRNQLYTMTHGKDLAVTGTPAALTFAANIAPSASPSTGVYSSIASVMDFLNYDRTKGEIYQTKSSSVFDSRLSVCNLETNMSRTVSVSCSGPTTGLGKRVSVLQMTNGSLALVDFRTDQTVMFNSHVVKISMSHMLARGHIINHMPEFLPFGSLNMTLTDNCYNAATYMRRYKEVTGTNDRSLSLFYLQAICKDMYVTPEYSSDLMNIFYFSKYYMSKDGGSQPSI